MAYSIAWDESAPDGSVELMSDVDTELQELKTSIRERMNDVLSNAWETDASNPKTLDPDAITAHPKVGLYLTGGDTITNGAAAAAIPTWDAEDFDVGSMFDAGSPSKITIPSDGKYLVTLFFSYSTAAGSVGGAFIVYLKLNGATNSKTYYKTGYAAFASSTHSATIAAILSLSEDDYIEVWANNTTGGDITMNGVAGGLYCSFCAAKLV